VSNKKIFNGYRGESLKVGGAAVLEQNRQLSMQERINNILRGKPIDIVHEESVEEAIQELVRELERAEHDLQMAQSRVDRLKDELERVTGKTLATKAHEHF
jgi:hypothetical protein